MVAKKHQSKRRSLKMKYNIQKKCKEFKKKLNRDMRRNPSQRPKRKDPGVPSAWPWKAEELAEAERQRAVVKDMADAAKAKRKIKIDAKRKLKENGGGSGSGSTATGSGKKSAKAAVNPAEQAILDAAAKHNIALADLRSMIELADVFIYVLDARNPLAFRSAQVEAMIAARPNPHRRIITVLNKAELVPVATLERWIKYFETDFPTLVFQCLPLYSDPNFKVQNQTHKQTGAGVDGVLELLRNYVLVAPTKPVNVAVIGHANVGKSSVINALRRHPVAAVSLAPFSTKTYQQIRLMDHVQIYDTPSFPLATDNSEADLISHNLVRVHDVKHPVDAVCRLLAPVPKEALLSTFKVKQFADVKEFLTLLATKRGALTKSEPNLPVVARSILQDWNDGSVFSYFVEPPKVQVAAVTGSKSADRAYADWGKDNHVSVSIDRQNASALTTFRKFHDSGAPVPRVLLPPAADTIAALVAGKRLNVDLTERGDTKSEQKHSAATNGQIDEAYIKQLIEAGDEKALAALIKSGALELDGDEDEDEDDDGEGEGDDDDDADNDDDDGADDSKSAMADAEVKRTVASTAAAAAPAAAGKVKRGPARPPAPVATAAPVVAAPKKAAGKSAAKKGPVANALAKQATKKAKATAAEKAAAAASSELYDFSSDFS